MAVNKRNKSGRMRAKTTHGYGSMKKNRGSGHKGGKGMAGSGKRADSKKPSVWEKKKYFGKFGFTSKKATKANPVNIIYLERNLSKLTEKKLAAEENGMFSIDLDKLGFNKLLSDGKALNKYRIKISFASKRAIDKIKEAGGEVILNKEAKED